MSQKKRTVLITGASTGIGKDAALFFHQKGWNVAATMRTPEKADEALKNSVFCTRLDVTDRASIEQGIKSVMEKFGDIDVLVNNAGYGLVGVFEASTPEKIQKQFATNVFGLMEVTRAILPHFRQKKSGVLINVASMGGRVTFPLYSLYHSTKWAVEGFSESLQHELKQFNIRVKIIEPGAIKTDFHDRSVEIMSAEGLSMYDEFSKKVIKNSTEAGQKGSPARNVAKVIYKAASDNTWKLRYSASGNAGMILFLRWLLPDKLFNGMIHKAVVK